jgi:NitT/TauT family transport system permease protein
MADNTLTVAPAAASVPAVAPTGAVAPSGEAAARPRRLRLPVRPVALLRVALLAGLLGLWELGYRTGRVDPYFFSAPSLIWDVLFELVRSGRIWPHVRATATEALLGLTFGFLAGAALGWIVSQSRLLRELVEPVMLLLNAVPRIVLVPLFIMWLGIGPNSKVAASFFLVFVVIFFAVSAGLREVPASLVARVRVLGGGRWTLFSQVYLPSVLVWVFSGLRVTVGFAFTGAVVAEFIASTEGLGYLLNFAQNSANASLMMATVAVIMLMIMAIFAVLERVERYLMRWKLEA